MENEIMSAEDLANELEVIGDAPPASEEGGDTPTETPAEEITPAGDEAKPEGAPAASGDGAPAKPAEEAIPRWRLNQEIERRKQAEQERAQLLQRLTGGQPNPTDSKPKAEEPAAPVPPNPKDFTDYDQYLDAREKFIEAKAVHAAKQASAEDWNRRQQEQRTQAVQQSTQERLAKAARNWEASAAQATAKDPNIQAHLDAGMRIPPVAGVHAMESEDPAALIARIGKTEGLVEKIWAMSEDQQIRAIARLEAEIAQEKKGNGGPVKKPSASVPVLNPARLGNNQSNADIFKNDVPVDAFARGLFPIPRR